MFPDKKKFKCKCGHEKKITKELSDKYKVSEKIESKESVIFTGEDVGL